MTAGAASNAVVDYWDGLPTTLPSEPPPQRSTILAADGSKIAEFFQENRVPLRLAEVAPIARRAVVAVEDDRFYSHGPIDLRGTLRALVNNSAGGGRQGGSTLTQQYVKNQLLNTATRATRRRGPPRCRWRARRPRPASRRRSRRR
nr:biosynthetic peptidoglycan transglycosylase [Arsenicicoccus piscis]